jgi:hypothetical protein
MSGSSTISGLFPCTDLRHIFPDKPRTITFDSDVFIGFDENDEAQSAMALVHYYVPPSGFEPTNGQLYFLTGKVASVDDKTVPGSGFELEDYDLVIEADMVRPLLS